MKDLTEKFQIFKKKFNTEIVNIYKQTKILLQKYEEKLQKHRIPLESTESEKESDESSDSEAEQEP